MHEAFLASHTCTVGLHIELFTEARIEAKMFREDTKQGDGVTKKPLIS